MDRPCLSVSFPPCLPPSSPSRVSASVFVTATPDRVSPLSLPLPPPSLSFSPLSFSRFVCSSRISLSLSLSLSCLRAHSFARTVSAAYVRAVSPSTFHAYRIPLFLPSSATQSRVSPVYVLLSVRLARFRARIARASAVLVAPAQETAAFLSSAPQTWLAPSRPSGPDRPRLPRRAPPLDQHPPTVPAHSVTLSLSHAGRPVLLDLSLSRFLPPIPPRYPSPRRGWSGTLVLSLTRTPTQVVGSLALYPSSGTHPPRAASSSAR